MYATSVLRNYVEIYCVELELVLRFEACPDGLTMAVAHTRTS